MTLRLDGRVVGPWVDELDRAWQGVAVSLGPRKLRVDLCGVLHMDLAARRMLASIYKTVRAEFVADTPMTKYFAAEAQRQDPKSAEEEP